MGPLRLAGHVGRGKDGTKLPTWLIKLKQRSTRSLMSRAGVLVVGGWCAEAAE
jgi:hypothetical protein